MAAPFSRPSPGPLAWAALGLALVLALPAAAQNRLGGRLGDPTQQNPIQQWQQRAAESELFGLIALEGALDADAYAVGPGDVFSISIGGPVPLVVSLPVSADGTLMLPEAGGVPAGGRTLTEVQTAATAALQQRFRNVPVEVTLSLPRQFYIHVTGAVPEPGRFLMMPVARVDDALQQAFAAELRLRPDPTAEGAPRVVGSATGQRPAANDAFRPSLRTVRVTHRDGTETSLDLIRYYTTGETAHNPYLRDGDVITVPAYHVDRDVVRVSGDVTYPGKYAFRPGDTALDLLLIAAGPGTLDDLGQVRLTRRASGGGVAENRLLDVGDLDHAPPLRLQPGDHLNVLPRTVAEAQINGMVEYPGTYPIADGETTLRELVEMAGGLQDDAALDAAFLERRTSMAFKEDGRQSDLDLFSRAFLQSRIHENRIVADIGAVLRGEAEDLVLTDRDRVVIPRDEGQVFVTGNVVRPGYVAFAPGQPARYYLERAGGKVALSKGVYVFEDGTGAMRTGEGAPVGSGDTIFVDRVDLAEPDQPELAQLLISERASRRQARILTTQNIITGVSAITGIITAYVALRNIN